MLRNSALVAAAVLFLVSLYATLVLALPLAPLAPPVEVDVTRGMGFRQVVDRLDRHGLVRDAFFFRTLGRLTGVDARVLPGRYRFQGSVSPWDVYQALREGDVHPVQLTVYEGDTLQEIRDALAAEGLISPAEFDRAAADPDLRQALLVNAPSFEGYLFPDTYQLDLGMSAQEIISIMVARLREQFGPDLRARAAELGLTERDVLTLASIIEKEAVADHERPLISAVYHNRLRRRMRLQADPTSIYGVKPADSPITRNDIARSTPYNTYHISGLPPGPIASPGLSSIRAALHPADVRYLYFVSNRDGTHTFSRTHEEHMRAVREYRRTRSRENG